MRQNPTALFLAMLVIPALNCISAFAQSGTCSGMSFGQGANLNGCVPFQASSLWNTDVSAVPVDANSSNIINFIEGQLGCTLTSPQGRFITRPSAFHIR
jgi:hypothetical protein